MKPVEESAKEMLEMEMPFRLNPKTFVLESDDPRIYMTGGGHAGPERGTQFVLHVGEKAFGFRTSDDIGGEKIEVMAGSTVLWWFDDLLCQLWGWEGGGERRILTNTYSFSSWDEQSTVLALFLKAMKACDTRVVRGVLEEPRVIARFTPRADQKVAAGKFLA